LENHNNREGNSLTKIISLGWGVQSYALVVMSAMGILPAVDYAIHADTSFENSETKALARKWTPWIEDHGIKIITDRPSTASLSFEKSIWMPAYTKGQDGKGNGILHRQCTDKWKIRPVNKWIRETIGEQVEKWIGFSCDELKRTRFKPDKWGKPVYPFIEYLQLSRAEIIQWLRKNGFDIPCKSSCIICPFHNDDEWLGIKNSNGGWDWEIAIQTDKKIRNMRHGYFCYLHQDRKPLDEIVFSTDRQLYL